MSQDWEEALGLEPGAPGDEVRRPLPRRPTPGRAFAPTTAPSLDALLDQALLIPVHEEPPLEVSCLAEDPDVVTVELAAGVLLGASGAVRTAGPGRFVLDGRAAPAAARFGAAAGEWVVAVQAGEVVVHRLASLGAAAPVPVPPEPPPLSVLGPMEAWLEERLAPHWTVQEPYGLAAAVGTFARYHAPADPRAAIARLLAGAPGPVERVRGWVDGVTPPLREHLVSVAFDEVGACRDAMDRMREAAVDAALLLGQQALLDLVERRDRLESVRWVVGGGGGPAPALDPELAALDAEVRAAWSERPAPTGLAGLRWVSELSWRDPHAWWGLE